MVDMGFSDLNLFRACRYSAEKANSWYFLTDMHVITLQSCDPPMLQNGGAIAFTCFGGPRLATTPEEV